MYPTLPFGPLSFPTGPILAILAIIVGLEVAGRYGRKLGLHPDDVWNTGLIAFASGLIVARLWNVFQFSHIYRAEPNLILSLRPSGFAFWPGVVAALIGGYAYLLYRALDPAQVGGALAIGGLAGGSIVAVSGYLTGGILGLPSDLPWALNYFGVARHPAGLYLAIGMAALAAVLWVRADTERPGAHDTVGSSGLQSAASVRGRISRRHGPGRDIPDQPGHRAGRCTCVRGAACARRDEFSIRQRTAPDRRAGRRATVASRVHRTATGRSSRCATRSARSGRVPTRSRRKQAVV